MIHEAAKAFAILRTHPEEFILRAFWDARAVELEDSINSLIVSTTIVSACEASHSAFIASSSLHLHSYADHLSSCLMYNSSGESLYFAISLIHSYNASHLHNFRANAVSRQRCSPHRIVE